MLPALPRLGVWFALGLATASAVFGQSVLVAEYKEMYYPVRDAEGSHPCIEVEGKRVVASGDRLALHKVDEYLPLFIAVRHVEAKSTGIGFVDGAGADKVMNHGFEFRADLSTRYPLEHVFLVLELTFKNGLQSLCLHEVGRMNPNEPKPVRLAVPAAHPLSSGQYRLHLFVEGREVLHSRQSSAEREGALDRIVAKRNVGRVDANPELLLGTPPEYPRKLEPTKQTGQVVLRVRILPTGAVADPAVLSASDPAFGAAALEVIRHWRFLPRMKGGHPIAAKVDIPLEFTPPEAPNS